MTGYHRRPAPTSGAFSRFVLSLGLSLTGVAALASATLWGASMAPVGYQPPSVPKPSPTATPGMTTVVRAVPGPVRTVTEKQTVAATGQTVTETATETTTETATTTATETILEPATPVTFTTTITTTIFTPGWP